MALQSQRPSGLALIEAEIRRQHADALASFAGAELPAARIAKSVRPTGRLLLVGMGASHFVNRIAEPVYRALGMDASAIVASEVLAQPLPDRPRSAILTSQSGASGEILQLLARPSGQEARFGLTLDGESALARAPAGTRPVVFHVSGEAPIPQALTVSLPRMQGLAAAIAILPALQHLLVRIAKQRVDRVGEPLRSTKVTGPE